MKNLILILMGSLVLLACKNESPTTPGTGSLQNSDWLIPSGEVFGGGPGKDGIPALENPKKVDPADVTFLSDLDLITGYSDGISAIAYPHVILDWHEIINDELNGFPYAITYCPLTGTGIGWDRTIDGTTTTFGVSGLLYNNNLIPYDRATDSNWSQMRNECVNGELIGSDVTTFSVIETTWKTWKEMFPNTKVVSTNTGFDRRYGVYPYGDYKTNNKNLIFPLEPDDSRLDRKERVHGVLINGEAKVYRFSAFANSSGTGTQIINDTFESTDIIIVGNVSKNLIVSFHATLRDGTSPEFNVEADGNIILSDTEGNKWDVFGYATAGPRTGERLIPTKSYIGYWFSWGTFYPEPDIYE